MVRKTFVFFIVCLFLISSACCYYYVRWRHLWSICKQESIYSIRKCNDDTLRILMIGDSWAGIHSEMHLDSFLSSEIKKDYLRPVSVISIGKGGEKSGGIYQTMFKTDDYGIKPLFLAGADYCVVFAGINDAAANLGTKQFCAHYRMIIEFLLANDICPVIIEIPDVDLWNIYGEKPLKDLLIDYLRSKMTGCKMYCFREYRDALKTMLIKEGMMDSVVYVPMTSWSENGERISQNLFMTDRVHLNLRGYERLDVCIAKAIVCDLDQSENSAFVNKPMNEDAE